MKPSIATAPAVGRAELLFVTTFTVLLLVLTTAPYVLGHLLSPPSQQFRENLVFETDFNSYYSYIRQSADGQWLFHDEFTPEPHGDVFFNAEWLLMGKLARLFGGSLAWSFHVTRWLATGVLALGVYWLCRRFYATPLMRASVFALILAGGGLGWLLGPAIAGYRLMDLGSGLYPFFWVFLQPHFLISEAFTVLALVCFLKGEEVGAARYYAAAGVCCVVVGTIRPYGMLYLMAATTLFAIARVVVNREFTWRVVGLRLLPCCVAFPCLLYYGWLFKLHPVFRWWGGDQATALPPEPASLAVSVGLLSPMLVVGLISFCRRKDRPREVVFLACCLLCSLGLIYSYPLLPWSRQFLTTLMVPLTLFALLPLERPLSAWVARRRAAVAVPVVFVAGASFTSLLLLFGHALAVAQGDYRIDGGFIAVCSWLKGNSQSGDVVLAAPSVANRMPRFTHNRQIAGYRFATVRYEEKVELVSQFFRADTDDEWRRQFLREYGVKFVVYGSDERSLGSYDPESSPFLNRGFANDFAAVYRVQAETAAPAG